MAASQGLATDAQYRVTFAGYVATVDNPGCMHWKELLRMYPDARVILTVRDPSAWFDSCSSTIFKLMPSTGLMPFGVRTAYEHHAHRNLPPSTKSASSC